MTTLMLTLVAGHEPMVEMTAEIEVMVAVEIEVMVAVHVGINWLKEPVPCKIINDIFYHDYFKDQL